MPENIRKLPSRARSARRAWRPPDSASETASGYSTPERAVLLGKRRRDHGVDDEDAVRQPERRPAEQADRQVADPRAEAALHHAARHEKRDDDEQDRAVGEPGPGACGRHDAGQHGDGRRRGPMRSESAARRRRPRRWRREDREQMPRGRGEAFRHRPEPHRDAEADDRHARQPTRAVDCHTSCLRPVIATGSSTSAICASVRIFFSRISSRMPRPVLIASAASSVDRS